MEVIFKCNNNKNNDKIINLNNINVRTENDLYLKILGGLFGEFRRIPKENYSNQVFEKQNICLLFQKVMESLEFEIMDDMSKLNKQDKLEILVTMGNNVIIIDLIVELFEKICDLIKCNRIIFHINSKNKFFNIIDCFDVVH